MLNDSQSSIAKNNQGIKIDLLLKLGFLGNRSQKCFKTRPVARADLSGSCKTPFSNAPGNGRKRVTQNLFLLSSGHHNPPPQILATSLRSENLHYKLSSNGNGVQQKLFALVKWFHSRINFRIGRDPHAESHQHLRTCFYHIVFPSMSL